VKKFRFPLQKLRDFRQLRFDQELAKLQSLVDQGLAVESQRAELVREDARVQRLLRSMKTLTTTDLANAENFRLWAEREEKRLAELQRQLEIKVAAQRQTLLEARRDVESLDHLKAQRLADWHKAYDKETEANVEELVISRWPRQE